MAVQPCSRTTVGAPGGPGSSRRRTVPGRQLDVAGRRAARRGGRDGRGDEVVERRQLGVDLVGERLGQAAATSRIRTRSWAPVGASYSTESPVRWPISAAPSGAVGLTTSRSSVFSSMWPTR